MNVVGICDGQDCGAALVKDGRLVAAVNEERLSRIKLHEGYYNGFPDRSLQFILKYIHPEKVDFVAISSKIAPPLPLRIYSFLANPKGTSAPTTLIKPGNETLSWRMKGLTYDYFCRKHSSSITGTISSIAYKPLLKRHLRRFGLGYKKIVFIDHHLCHASSAYYTSGIDEGVSFSLDGHGDGLSATISLLKS